MNQGLLLVLSAPSGAGKTTLTHHLLQSTPSSLFSVSYTTRLPRGQERDGVDYHFVSDADFQDMVQQRQFVEWAQVHGHWYGTHRNYVDQAGQGRLVIFDIDVQGGEAIKREYPEAVLVFLLPPSMEELERRLRDRGTDADQVIQRRLGAARAEMNRGCAGYDYLVINQTVEQALSDLRAIIRAEECRRERMNLSSMGLITP